MECKHLESAEQVGAESHAERVPTAEDHDR